MHKYAIENLLFFAFFSKNFRAFFVHYIHIAQCNGKLLIYVGIFLGLTGHEDAFYTFYLHIISFLCIFQEHRAAKPSREAMVAFCPNTVFST